MIRFDLILIFRDRAQNVWWYWRTPEEAVSWARGLFPDVRDIQVSWRSGSGLQIQDWRPAPEEPGEPIDPMGRWKCLEMDP